MKRLLRIALSQVRRVRSTSCLASTMRFFAVISQVLERMCLSLHGDFDVDVDVDIQIFIL